MNLFALIKADPTCTALLGANPTRFFEFGTAPELEALPYATHQELTGTPLNLMEGSPSTDHIKTQIDVWGRTASETRAVTRAIRKAIDPTCLVTYFQNTYDVESRLYRAIVHVTHLKEI